MCNVTEHFVSDGIKELFVILHRKDKENKVDKSSIRMSRQYTGNSLKSLDLSGKGKASQFCFRPGLDHLKCVENNEKNMQMGSLVANILI